MVPRTRNLSGYRIHNAEIKMFNVSLLSEVDVNLAEAHSLIVQVNEKLSKCSNVSMKEVLSRRVQMILSEIQWTEVMSRD